MARIRNIKPDFFDDEGLASVSSWARLCFIGLWTQADRAGRLEDRPGRLKARLFPFDANVNVADLIDELATEGCVVRYAVNGSKLLFIPRFAKHQYLSKREPASTLPETDEHQTSTTLVLDESYTTPTDIGHRTEDRGHKILAPSVDDAGEGKATKPRTPRPATENQPIKALLSAHERFFVARYGEKPGPYTGKHGKLAASVLKTYGLERSTALLALFFSSEDPFFEQAGHAFPAFTACIPKIIALASQGAALFPNDPPAEERLYDCRQCGEFHQGADSSVCSRDRGPVYKCQVCAKPHQGHDPLCCMAQTEATA